VENVFRHRPDGSQCAAGPLRRPPPLAQWVTSVCQDPHSLVSTARGILFQMKASIQLLGLVLLVAAVFFPLAGCDQERRLHSRGFHLPEGDSEVGRATFVELKCHRCHTVDGIGLPAPGAAGPPRIALGGEIHRVRSYGELVTSIITPQHVISEKYLDALPEPEKEGDVRSPMPVFNHDMTVAELSDLVAFLHSRYRLIEPATDQYHYVMP